MKQAVAYLQPYIEAEKSEASRPNGRILMATVKGDVHDIGKNIVGVVLGCNNFEVIDLGVMVPCEKILQTAVEQNVDIIGLSGLITPSLDEMVFVAKEMERLNIQKPLLIGGATTSKAHTAVKIDPQFNLDQTVYVADASRAVGVATTLLSNEKSKFVEATKAEYEVVRERRARSTSNRTITPYENAITQGPKVDWHNFTPTKPKILGTKALNDYPLEDILPYIDWTPFFISWDLAGKYPKILDDAVVGEAARQLFDEAQIMLKDIVSKKLLTANGVIGFWPAQAETDDIVISDDKGQTLARCHHLRQQISKDNSGVLRSLADFVAPASSGVQDYLGGFAVTVHGAEALAKDYEQKGDDYSAIMVKALADRFAEAFAEHLHERVRKEFWGYVPEETLDNDALIREKYQGIRPAPGYPACPDHTEKATLFSLLDASNQAGVELTEHFAMYPAASVSGWYFANPEARYFNVGNIGKDQVESIAARKELDVATVERWLQPNLAY